MADEAQLENIYLELAVLLKPSHPRAIDFHALSSFFMAAKASAH